MIHHILPSLPSRSYYKIGDVRSPTFFGMFRDRSNRLTCSGGEMLAGVRSGLQAERTGMEDQCNRREFIPVSLAGVSRIQARAATSVIIPGRTSELPDDFTRAKSSP